MAAPIEHTGDDEHRASPDGRRQRTADQCGRSHRMRLAEQEERGGDVADALFPILAQAALNQRADRGRHIRGKRVPVGLALAAPRRACRIRRRPGRRGGRSTSRTAHIRTPRRRCACRPRALWPARDSCTRPCRGSCRRCVIAGVVIVGDCDDARPPRRRSAPSPSRGRSPAPSPCRPAAP